MNKYLYRLGSVTATASSAAILSPSFLRRSIASCESRNANIDHQLDSMNKSKDLLNKNSLPKVVLYQYQICPFCNRAKAYLEYLKIPYEAIEVNPLTKGEISFSKDYKKVPIAIINGNIVNEGSNIIKTITEEVIAKDHKSVKAFFPSDTQVWDEWSEKTLAVYLYPNITRSFSESYECFGYTANVTSWNMPLRLVTRFAGAGAMTLANSKIKKKYNIIDERKELDQEIQKWIIALGNKNFLHGDVVTMPDILVFGVLKSIQGLTTFNEIMNNNPTLAVWYNRVDSLIKN